MAQIHHTHFRINALPARLFSAHLVIDFLIVTALISKLLHSWLFIALSEHHYTTQTSKDFLNRSATMLNNVFNLVEASVRPNPPLTTSVSMHSGTKWTYDSIGFQQVTFPACVALSTCSGKFLRDVCAFY